MIKNTKKHPFSIHPFTFNKLMNHTTIQFDKEPHDIICKTDTTKHTTQQACPELLKDDASELKNG